MDERAAESNPPGPACMTTADVLFHEYQLIWGSLRGKRREPEYYGAKANAKGQAALCLSGGGIRSAAFALGLMQVLSRSGLLTGFHYLSTVSGGGYMGSWLQRWIHEEGKPKEPGGKSLTKREAAKRVMSKLGATVEPDEVKRLRENSNFITPRVGIGSNDTWTAVAISVRNIVVNWLLFAPLLMLVALLPNLFLEGVASIRGAAHWHVGVLYALLAATFLSVGYATASTAMLLPSYRDDAGKPAAEAGAGDRVLSRRIVAPLVIWSIFATLALSVEVLDRTAAKIVGVPIISVKLDVALVSLAGMIAGLMVAAVRLRGDFARTFDKDYLVWPSAFLVTTAWLVLGVTLADWYFPSSGLGWAPVLMTVFGPLWILTATLMGAIVFAAFRQSEGPRVRPDDDREWLARLSAVKIRPMLLWGVLAPSVLLLNRLWGVDVDNSYLSLPSLVTVLSGLAAVFGGRSERTAATATGTVRKAIKFLPLSLLIGLATLLFVVALLMLFGRLELMLATWVGKQVSFDLGANYGWLDPDVAVHLLVAVTLLLLLWYFGRRIPVNRFSLNGLYRNRLARGFLGAARPSREPDRFTGFDSADNCYLHRLAPGAGDRAVLYPVINVALNVTATENLAWQERKAEPFVFTPAYCGSGMLSRAGKSPSRRTGAYVDTRLYGGREPDTRMIEADMADAAAGAEGSPCLGVTLATAMSLSGAAATPNMGYYSSPATAFLMTLFNVRLGAWLPNPSLSETPGFEIRRANPVNSITALFSELTGSTHDRGPDVYLSDGGHFENLALYEMIRRRCRFIVVSDAAADPLCGFKDLGSAVRKVKIDFDVNISFSKLHIAGRDNPLAPAPQLSWALGVIEYPEEDCRGLILYIKPSFFGEGLPVDVIAYARNVAAFPHESTADQFFSESQFESYRRLADHFLEDLVRKMGAAPKTIESLFRAAWEETIRVSTPPAAPAPPAGPAPVPEPAP